MSSAYTCTEREKGKEKRERERERYTNSWIFNDNHEYVQGNTIRFKRVGSMVNTIKSVEPSQHLQVTHITFIMILKILQNL